ncbi:AbrB family transcriptional regulator [Roseovarius pelagicus]|uniref:AbrB family transcriptional regulator n=1 Tax=Roseovarius pelagicus TaxID=2980108 RepID=A0ABY6DEW0_9RHOB|nr:AbrB family transcriptional regulator [Roseovarius pelagicus]UXX84610.1 AbrB family transcriptional regulator [Roseovarius pelagicus]
MLKIPDQSTTRARLLTLGVAGSGTAVAWVLGLPLPFLFGPLGACLIAAMIGVPLKRFGWVSTAARTILGVAVGASLTPALVGTIPQMAASVALIPIYIAVIAMIGVPFFHRVCGFDRTTAWYAAMPGGLQDMVIFGTEAGGDPRALSLIHATRLLIVVSLAPLILTFGMGADLSGPIGPPASNLPLWEILLMVIAALVGWKGGERIGLFGASILGPMIVTGILSLSGLIHSRPPSEGILFAQFMIGISIGVGYVGITLAEFRKDVLSGVAFVLVLAALAAILTEVVVIFGLAPPIEGFLAFAPGGQAEMTVLAIVADVDLGFVVVHHLARIFLVITCAPIAARMLIKSNKR